MTMWRLESLRTVSHMACWISMKSSTRNPTAMSGQSDHPRRIPLAAGAHPQVPEALSTILSLFGRATL